MKLPFRFFFIILSVGLLFVRCKNINDFESYNLTNIEAEFGVPLFSTSFNMNDILENFEDQSSIELGPDGLIILRYQGDVAARSSDDIFKVVLDTINGLPVPIFDTLISIGIGTPNGIDLDFAKLKSGFLQWGFSSAHEEDVSVTLKFPKLTKDGVSFETTLPGAYGGSTPVAGISGQLNLTGYELDVENDSVEVRYQAFRQTSGFNDTVSAVFVIFNDVQSSYVEGFLGSDLYEFERDTIFIDFFENWTRGEVYFVDPKINVTVTNSFGIPVRSDTKVLDIFTFNGGVLPLESQFVDDGIDFAYPSLDEVGEYKVTQFSFNNTNSNIVDIISAGPVAVDYHLDAIPNPDSLTTLTGFLTDTSNFVAQVDVELPLYGSTFGFGVFDTISVDTFDFNIDLGAYGEADYAEFKLVAENEMPLDIHLEFQFADANGQVLTSLFEGEERIINAAGVDGEGNVIQTTRKETFARMENEQFEQLTKTKFLYLVTSFSTNNEGTTNVKILASQGVELGMGLKLGVTK